MRCAAGHERRRVALKNRQRYFPQWSEKQRRRIARRHVRAVARSFSEQRVLEMPEQHWWLHKRFKTRPRGKPGAY